MKKQCHMACSSITILCALIRRPQEVRQILYYTREIAHTHPAHSHSPPLPQRCPHQPTGGQRIPALHQRNRSLSPFALPFPTPHANMHANFTCLPLPLSTPTLPPSHTLLSLDLAIPSPPPPTPPALASLLPKTVSVNRKTGGLATYWRNLVALSITGDCAYLEKILVSRQEELFKKQKFIFAVQPSTDGAFTFRNTLK